MKNVMVVIGSGSIGQAIARRVSAGNSLADLHQEKATAAQTLTDAGFAVTAVTVDVSSRDSAQVLARPAISPDSDINF